MIHMIICLIHGFLRCIENYMEISQTRLSLQSDVPAVRSISVHMMVYDTRTIVMSDPIKSLATSRDITT